MYKALRFTLVSLLMMLCGTAFADSWEKATSLSVGDVVVMAAEKGEVTKELTAVTTSGTTIGTATDYTGTPAGTYALTIVAGSQEGSIAFKTTDNKYLSWSSGNSLTTAAEVNDASSWTVEFNEGLATVTNVRTTARILQYNAGSPRFACYTSAQTKLTFFKKVAAGGGDEPQTETKAIYLKPGIWAQDDARFVAYLFNSDKDNTWVDFAPVEGATGYYTATIPTSYAKMILVRMRAGSTENIWPEMWNQTEDIDISSLVANTLYKITAWGDEKSPYVTTTYPEPITTPVISPNGGTFIEYQEVTLSCETEGAKIYYTIDGSEPSDQTSPWNPDRGIRLSQTSTVKAIAYVGENKSAVATATFTKVSAYSTIAELTALENNTPFAFTGEAFVVAVAEKTTKSGTAKYVYIHDNSGNSLIYDATSANTADVEAGRFINPNWTGKVSIYKNLFEVTPDQALTVGVSKYDVSYPDFSEREINKVVSLKNVESFTVDGSNITINVKGADKSFVESYGLAGYNQFGIEIPAAEEGKLYEIIGVVGKYDQKDQFWPIEIKEQTAEPEPEPDPDFYVVGTMTDPAWSIVEANKMTMNEIVENEKHIKEFSLDMTLEADAVFKVVSSTDGKTIKSWFPAEGENYKITEAGDYTIYCRPNYDGHDDWHAKVLYAAKKAQEPEPVVIENMYLVGDFTGGWPTQDAETQAWDWSMAKEMTKSTDPEKANIWTYEIKGFEAEAKTYEYKVSANKNWDGYKLPDNGNANFNFNTADYGAGKYDLLFTVDTKENTVELVATKVEEPQPAEPTIADGTYYLKNKKEEKYISTTGMLQEEGSPFTFKFDSKTGTYTITTADFFAGRQWYVEGNDEDGYTISYLADSQKKYFAASERGGATELDEVPADGSATWFILSQGTEPEPVVIENMYLVGDFTGGWPTQDAETQAWDWSMAKEMTKSTDPEKANIWTYEIKGFEAEAKTYKYKVSANKNWDGYKLPDGAENYEYAFGTEGKPAGKYDLLFTVDTKENTVELVATKVEEPQPEPNTYTATFDNAGNWEKVYAYAWSGEDPNVTEFLGEWPGTELNAPANGETAYTVTIKAAEAPAFIVFNNGQAGVGNQTEDLAFENGKAYTYEVPVVAQTATFNFADPNFREKVGTAVADVDGFIYNETFTADGATLQITAGSAPSRIYVDNNRGQSLVTYKEYTTLTFKAPEGKAITKIEFTAAGTSSIKYFTASSGAIDGMVWTGNADGVRFTQGGTSYLANAIVTLADKDAETAALPAIKYAEAANIAAFNALENGTYAKLTLTDAEVIGKSADGYSTVWVQDATGGAFIQYTSLNDRLQEKTKISGTIYTIKRANSGNSQLKEAEATIKSEFTAEAIDAYTTVEGTIAEVNVAANLNKVVKISGATLAMTSNTAGTLTLGETTISVNNGAATANQQLHKIADWEKDKVMENVTIVAILVATSATDATKNQLLPISIEEQQPEDIYTVVGDEALIGEGYNWNVTYRGSEMELNAESGLYEWNSIPVDILETTELGFKIVKNNAYENGEWPAGMDNNWVIKIGATNEIDKAGNYTFKITFNPETGEIGVIATYNGPATGIASIKAAQENGAAIYTLQGVRVNNVKKGGMYIVNGKKVAIK